MRGGCCLGDPHVAAEASRSLEDGIPRKRNTRCRPPKYWLNCGFQADHATHVLNMSEKWEAFVLCGCAELNDPPQRCLIGLQVDRKYPSLMRVGRAMSHFQAVEVSGGRTRRNHLDTVVQNTPWTQPSRKDCMV
ncbi:hypothetical protein TcYC6_0037580 [Trypanosoma cruzi]|nr:hypothetical protein TcYC6_0020320 [Trypanosoma cruzi]KAF8304183.1 hypothetical protein TcYC6_0037580 [Trypanosoma cruzi]